MSKSYKKTPILQDGYGSKQLYWYKRQANKTVRRKKEISSGKAYRKVYDTWIFRDYVFRETYTEHVKGKESELKHYLNVYGSIEKIPERRKKEFYDIHNYTWKKYYYKK